MPQIFKVAGYVVYFWANENDPLEPVHVHIAEGIPTAHATKVWITKSGKCLLCNNNSKIKESILRDIIDVIEARSNEVLNKWNNFFEETHFYC
jgi:hypothetical protein